jgi:beta-glucosidase
LYVSKVNSKVERADKELKVFKKVLVSPGADGNITLNLSVNDLAYFDESLHKWVVEPGEYKILAGESSRDIRQTATINVN